MRLGLDPTHQSSNICRPEWLRQFAQLATTVGADSIWMPEHMAFPQQVSTPFPYSADGTPPYDATWKFPDPIDWLSWMAAITEDVALCPAVLILPQHHPIQLAKRLATLDQLSQGRARAGVGVGWLREELELFSVPFERRGQVADEYVHALRTLWSQDSATYHGQFISFTEVASELKTVQPGGVPIIVGGSSLVAARRAGRLGDGYMPIGVKSARLVELLETMRAAALEVGRDPGAIEITVRATMDIDEAKRLADVGVHRFNMPVRTDQPFRDAAGAVERFVAEILTKVDGPDIPSE
jgi:probable F420-dependent oxidoreductase